MRVFISGTKEQESHGDVCVIQPSKQLKLGGGRGVVPELICIVLGKDKFGSLLCDKLLGKRFASLYRCLAFGNFVFEYSSSKIKLELYCVRATRVLGRVLAVRQGESRRGLTAGTR